MGMTRECNGLEVVFLRLIRWLRLVLYYKAARCYEAGVPSRGVPAMSHGRQPRCGPCACGWCKCKRYIRHCFACARSLPRQTVNCLSDQMLKKRQERH